jgi:hypothetical protein
MNELLIAFFSASLAFLFFVIGEAVLRSFDRGARHCNALVSLERLLNQQLDEIHVIEWQVPKLRPKLEQGHALIDLPRPIPTAAGVQGDLFEIDLVNRLFSSDALLRRGNNDIENLRAAYGQLLDRYLDGALPRDDYIENCKFIVSGYEALVDGLKKYREESDDLLARVRLRQREGRRRPWRLIKGLTGFLMVATKPLSDGDVKAERKKLADEVKETIAHSRERLDPAGLAKGEGKTSRSGG